MDQAEFDEGVDRLSRRELQVARLWATGRPVAELVSRLGTSSNTVRSQVKAIYAKCGVHDRTEFALLARGNYWLGRSEDGPPSPSPADDVG